MQINIIDSYRKVVTLCDKELIGKKFEEGEFQLDIKENFYVGEEKSPEEIKEILQDMQKEDATFNIVGEKSVQLAIEAGIINENQKMTISEIPFSLSLL